MKKRQLLKSRIPISVSFPFDVLQLIDQTAYSLDLTRSGFILQSVTEKIKKLEEEQAE